METLKNKNIVITGCNRGIGKAILEKYAEHGCNIYAVVRKISSEFRENISRLEHQYNCNIFPVSCDFSFENDVKECAKIILQKKEKIDILINNIGVSPPPSILNMTQMSTIKSAFQINFFSPLLFTQMLSKNMIKNKYGKIIFISSTAAFDGGNNIEYASSKGAINSAIKRLSIEYGAYNINVNGIAPGLTDTDMGKSQHKEAYQIALQRCIKKRMARPDEIADVALFLGSNDSDFITGQILKVDGGKN